MESYRNQSGQSRPFTVEFRTLSAETRARFVRATLGQESTGVLLSARRPGLGTARGWLLVALLGGATLLGAWACEFGALPVGREPSPLAPLVHATGAAVAIFGLAMAARSHRVRGSLPFLPGVYLFARELVDARRGTLTIVPIEGLSSVNGPFGEGEKAQLTLRFDDATYELPAGDWGPQELVDELVTLRRASDRAADRDDLASLAWLDPFFADRASWRAVRREPRGALVRFSRAERWAVPAIGLASVVAGQQLGAASYEARREMSDAVAVDAAAREGSDRALDAYLRAGGPLLDRADARRLSLAEARDTPIAYEYYLRSGGLQRQAADDAFFSLARRRGTGEALRRYLEVGVRHRAEAEALLASLDDRRAAVLPLPVCAPRRRVRRTNRINFKLVHC